MKKLLFTSFFIFSFFIFSVSQTQAANCGVDYTCSDGCNSVDQCVNNKKCALVTDNEGNTNLGATGGACGSAQVGSIVVPGRIGAMNTVSNGNGLILFISRLINLFAIICGIWTMFNFLYGGFLLIMNQYDTKAQSEVKDKITMSIIGLVIIASAYTIAGLVGLIFFGNAAYILNPTFTGPVK